ncbi:hypothetical protein XELAEV_18004123mg [Xenopus laevis]|uniref:Dolichol phosphate-mannose biosynthesis regulatory protein n=1 Tax=Xenopus laevis TaxID=8355 RepID=A0A974BRQ1_XENLA|nr:hypothetical protein XELAEV_18004123mg [Xenopus laevis]
MIFYTTYNIYMGGFWALTLSDFWPSACMTRSVNDILSDNFFKSTGHGYARSSLSFYTCPCLLFQPFIDNDHVIHSFFLPREYAVLLPLAVALVLLLFIGIFVTFIMWKSRSPKKKSE